MVASPVRRVPRDELFSCCSVRLSLLLQLGAVDRLLALFLPLRMILSEKSVNFSGSCASAACVPAEAASVQGLIGLRGRPSACAARRRLIRGRIEPFGMAQ